MPIDPSISLGVKPLEVANPLNQFAQVAQLQHYQQQNALAQRAMEQEDALNAAYAASLNPKTGQIDENMLRKNLTGANLGSKLPAVEKSLLDARKVRGEVEAKDFELRIQKANKAIKDIAGFNTREEILADLQRNIDAGNLDPVRGQQIAASVPQNPAEVPAWQLKTLRGILDAKDQLEQHFVSQDIGGSTRVVAMPKFGGGPAQVVQGSAVNKTMTPDAAARLAAESAVGTLTPESLDIAANVYLQTGQLPTGLGKQAANLRTQVMNRATELSTGKAPAEVAGGLVEAKQDVASRGKAVKDFSTGMQGRQVNAFNTAIDHLATMDKLADALANNDIKAFNAIGNAFARQTGSAAPSNFDTAKNIVAAEVAKAVAGSNMALKDREEIRDQILASSSPEQLKGVTTTLKQLLGGQLNSLSLQYANTTGRKDFDSKLTPAAKAEVQRLRGGEQKPANQTGALTPAEQAELEQLRARFKK